MKEIGDTVTDKAQNLRKYKKCPGIVLLKKIKDGELDPEALTPTMRRLCVRVMRYEGGAPVGDIADILRCSGDTIYRDFKKIEQENLDVFTGVQIRRELSEILLWAETYAQLEARAGNFKEAWKIRKEKIEMLQSFGFLPKDLGTLKITGEESNLAAFRDLDEDKRTAAALHIYEARRLLEPGSKE